jgi:hypothetical protein
MRNFLLTLLTFWPALLSAQQRALTGRVASSTGEPVRGANVFLLETLDGTITGLVEMADGPGLSRVGVVRIGYGS